MNLDFGSIQNRCLAEFDVEQLALELYEIHKKKNPIYRQYLDKIGYLNKTVHDFLQIPFLPIRFFKSHQIYINPKKEEKIFGSSGTSKTGLRSKHFISDIEFYHQVSFRGLNLFFPDLCSYHIIAYLPSYVERPDSSLISMVNHLGTQVQSIRFVQNSEEMLLILDTFHSSEKVMLWGVSFALWDLCEKMENSQFEGIIVETGGMKSYGEEIVKQQLMQRIKTAFPKASLFSEYGMTELKSQAYASIDLIYQSIPTLKVTSRSVDDPFEKVALGKRGVLQFIDFANVDTCPFIETEDLGIVRSISEFEILGRLQTADLRGCHLLMMD
ncbi:MAG TPA: acyl transferase [Saprospiraceae bacterium]|nr:acyl transferase [Saprospiraceae bacterium]